jgi:hypothetical protein
MKEFLEDYVPGECLKASEETIRKYEKKVPASLIELWKANGFGKYNDGLIEIINPDDFNEVLWTYLGREVDSYVPIALNAFGDLFYYRKLTDDEDLEAAEDVCVVEIHYRVINTCAWSLKEFFDDYLCDKDVIEILLRKALFDEAVQKEGKLERNEIYYFTPAIVLGGAEEVKFIEKGNAQVHQEILFQIGIE